jgi:hypothetical protein
MINTLPQSLIDTATKILMNNGRITEAFVTTLHHPVTSLHCANRNKVDPMSIFGLYESFSDFHNWAMQTESKFTKLQIDSYLRNDDKKDNEQIGDRLRNTPMSHPDLFHTHFNGLNHDERKTAHDFIHIGLRQDPQYSSGSVRINTHLLGAYNADAIPQPFIKHHNGELFDLHTMDKALENSKLPHDLTTYSGIGFNPADHLIDRSILKSPTFLATSTRRFVSGKYALGYGEKLHHILQIQHHKNDSGLYVGNITPLSSFSDDEYILPRNTTLKIDGHTDYIHHDRTFRVWDTSRYLSNQSHNDEI